ncbi:MAG TPA: AtpZ/AtpI family protein [Acidobacteriota bacterium]|nr:AtpZ/AtpI family protein [Acidobacteriota bacterium]
MNGGAPNAPPFSHGDGIVVEREAVAYIGLMNKWHLYAELSAAGLVFVAAILVGLWVGNLLDNIFGTAPFLTLSLMALGLAAAVLNLLKTLKRLEKSG